MELNSIKPADGAKHAKRRVGRGIDGGEVRRGQKVHGLGQSPHRGFGRHHLLGPAAGSGAHGHAISRRHRRDPAAAFQLRSADA